MRKRKLLAGVLSAAMVLGSLTLPSISEDSTLTAEASSETECHAYLYFQTDNSSRYPCDNQYYGLYGSYNTDEITYDVVHTWGWIQYEVGSYYWGLKTSAGTFTDATITGDGTYTVSVSGLELADDEFTDTDGVFDLLGLSTDITWGEAEITIDSVVIGDNVFSNPAVYEEDEDSDYILLDVENYDNDVSLGDYDNTSSYISITFTVSGLFSMNNSLETGASTVTDASELTSEATNNSVNQYYNATYGSPVYSYLVSVNGGFMRVEYNDEDVVVEYYDNEYTLLDKKYVTVELPLFGGFYAGEDAYYLVFGQENPDEDDSVEVIRVVKYSTDWERLGNASVYGADTYIPFDAGSCRLAEYNGYLYIRTCHEMYASSSGVHHQSNFTIVIREISMSVIFSQYSIKNNSTGYVSHSFDQFVLVDDEGYLVAADHGDNYPRAASLFKYTTKAGLPVFMTENENVEVLSYVGKGENYTGASVGGFEYSSSSYLIAGNCVDQDDDYASHTVRNIYVGVVSRDDISSSGTSVNWITDYDADGEYSATTPKLVKLGTDSFLLLWTVTYTDDSIKYGSLSKLNYVFLDGDGNTTSEIYEVDGQLSDCQPILVDNEVVWYVTGDSNVRNSMSTTPMFYSINLNGNYTAPETLESPSFEVSLTKDGIEVTWNEVEGAEGYNVYFTHDAYFVYSYDVDSETTSYTFDGDYATDGDKYYVWVEAYSGNTKSLVQEKKGIYYFVPTATNEDGQITVGWSAVDGATSYDIYRKTDGSYTKIATTEDVSWIDEDITGGTTYTYQICTVIDGEDVYSLEVSTTYLVAPTLISLENGPYGLVVTWNTVDGAEKYRLTQNTSTVSVGAEDTDEQSCILSATSGTEYTVYIRAYSGSYASVKSNAITYLYLSKPTVTLTTNDSDISLSWSAITGADGYKIYRKVGDGSYSLVDTITDTSWTDTDISASTLYTYQVYAYSGDYISAGSTEKTGGSKAISDCEVTLSETSYTYDGTSKRPTVTIYDGTKLLTSGTDYSLSYSSSVRPGTVTITVTGKGNYTGTTTATYTIEKADQTLTASIASSSITYGGTSQITASGTGTISYSSSNTSVATVSSSGLVTATGAGTATITVTAAGSTYYNSATTTINVTVTKADQTLTASIASSSITYGGTSQITASGTGTISYSSSDTSVATVSSSGLVTATGAGTATITVTAAGNSNYNSATKTISVTVTKASQTLTASIANSSITYGGTSQITASGTGTITYSSSDTSVATVSSSGLVTATGAGTATITVTAAGNSNYNSATKTISVTVTKASQTLTASIANSSITYGGTSQINASGTGTISYSSSNTSVATVSSSGLVTATGAGTATITVTAAGNSNYNSATKTISVTVTKASQALTASIANSSITYGNTSQITASGTGTISYSSSDTSVATVSSSGLVTATGAGTATITVTAAGNSNYNSATKTISVTVTAASVSYLLGDVNEDGEIDYLDAMTVLRYDAELITLDSTQLLAGDVNGDGAVDSLDAILILRYDADLIDSF